jgi:hypothetical protein
MDSTVWTSPQLNCPLSAVRYFFDLSVREREKASNKRIASQLTDKNIHPAVVIRYSFPLI